MMMMREKDRLHPGRSALESRAGLLSLDGREPGKLVLGHRDLGTALEPVGSTAEERGTVRVHGLVAGGSALEAGLGGGIESWGSSSLGGLALLEVLDDGGLEGELDQVEGEVPDDVPDPDNSNPATRDSSDPGEPPVTVSGNDGRDELSDTEGDHEGGGRALSPRGAVRTGDEDEGLGDDGDLEVDDHVSSPVVDVVALGEGLDTEPALKEVGVAHDGKEGDRGGGEVDTVTDTVGEDLGEIPRVGVDEGSTRSTERVMMVPSLRTAMIRTMNAGKSNSQTNAMMAKQTTIRMVTAQA